jgi:hypothetical protein
LRMRLGISYPDGLLTIGSVEMAQVSGTSGFCDLDGTAIQNPL